MKKILIFSLFLLLCLSVALAVSCEYPGGRGIKSGCAENQYCSSELVCEDFKIDNETCYNAYECLSYKCAENICGEEAPIGQYVKTLSWLQEMNLWIKGLSNCEDETKVGTCSTESPGFLCAYNKEEDETILVVDCSICVFLCKSNQVCDNSKGCITSTTTTGTTPTGGVGSNKKPYTGTTATGGIDQRVGAVHSYCGDGVCYFGESYSTCQEDCPSQQAEQQIARCGDGTPDYPIETCENCPIDIQCLENEECINEECVSKTSSFWTIFAIIIILLAIIAAIFVYVKTRKPAQTIFKQELQKPYQQVKPTAQITAELTQRQFPISTAQPKLISAKKSPEQQTADGIAKMADYIDKNLKAGYTQKNIRDFLKSKGYSAEYINKAVQYLKNRK